ncbi:HNH endonuclease [Streptomyces sp. NPDC097727]|uniref:HNH endonuclease n=1 Tax=Streptomyces sp. NPDC097727 TaxID=3366092 RepID=UPI0038134E3B
MKRSKKCGVSKQLDAFHKRKKSTDGRHHICKVCRAVNPETYRPQGAPRPDCKTCTRCREEKPLGEFTFKGDYTMSRCKPCLREVSKEWYQANPERVRARDRARRERNPERVREIQRASYRRNRGYYAAKNAEWIRNNSEANRARRARYRARKAAAPGTGVTAAEWRALVAAYGGYCLACLRTGLPLEADHVIPLSLGGAHQIDNIQPLCRSCNASKADRVGQLDYRVYFDLAV